MSWKNYKNKVVDSRDMIIVPTLMAELTGLSGSGLDVGCGDGDLANILSKSIQATIYGIDIDKDNIEEARKKIDNNVYIVGDLTKRAISKTGVRFKFAFSNCFLNHLDNPSAMACIDDMRSSLEKDAKVVIIVPHWRRAEKNYRKPKRYFWGVTAFPDYGNKQYFRYGEWYCKALTDAGYVISKHETVFIPEALENSERYGKDIGKPIFSLIVADVNYDPDSIEIARKAFEIAHDNRKFEIDMLWKRSLFYWGFIAASFVGVIAANKENSKLSIVFCLFGFMCSVAWAAGNRGSKYWQEYWENKVVLFQNRVTGDIFIDHFPVKSSIFSQFSARKLSVSKLLMGVSDFTLLLWLVMLFYMVMQHLGLYKGPMTGTGYSCAIVFTVLYSMYVVFKCKSED